MEAGGKVQVIHRRIKDFDQFENYDVIIMAALVGSSADEKGEIVKYIYKKMPKEQLLLVKNFVKLKSLLSPTIDIASLTGLNIKLLVEKTDGVTNQFIFLEK